MVPFELVLPGNDEREELEKRIFQRWRLGWGSDVEPSSRESLSVMLSRPASSLDYQVLVDPSSSLLDPSCYLLSNREVLDGACADEKSEEDESEGVGGEVL